MANTAEVEGDGIWNSGTVTSTSLRLLPEARSMAGVIAVHHIERNITAPDIRRHRLIPICFMVGKPVCRSGGGADPRTHPA